MVLAAHPGGALALQDFRETGRLDEQVPDRDVVREDVRRHLRRQLLDGGLRQLIHYPGVRAAEGVHLLVAQSHEARADARRIGLFFQDIVDLLQPLVRPVLQRDQRFDVRLSPEELVDAVGPNLGVRMLAREERVALGIVQRILLRPLRLEIAGGLQRLDGLLGIGDHDSGIDQPEHPEIAAFIVPDGELVEFDHGPVHLGAVAGAALIFGVQRSGIVAHQVLAAGRGNDHPRQQFRIRRFIGRVDDVQLLDLVGEPRIGQPRASVVPIDMVGVDERLLAFQLGDFLGEHPEFPGLDQGAGHVLVDVVPAAFQDHGIEDEGAYDRVAEEFEHAGIAEIVVERILRCHELLDGIVIGVERRGERELRGVRRVEERGDQIEVGLDAVIGGLLAASGAVQPILPPAVVESLAIALGRGAYVEHPLQEFLLLLSCLGNPHRSSLTACARPRTRFRTARWGTSRWAAIWSPDRP